MDRLESELRELLNRYSAENESDTPDFILAGFLRASLTAFNGAVNARSLQARSGGPPVTNDAPDREARIKEELERAEWRASNNRPLFGDREYREHVRFLLDALDRAREANRELREALEKVETEHCDRWCAVCLGEDGGADGVARHVEGCYVARALLHREDADEGKEG